VKAAAGALRQPDFVRIVVGNIDSMAIDVRRLYRG
jgi:hypothetical protein